MLDHLRNEILMGNFEEGTFIKQRTIAEKYGVSRTPAREALKALESEGLLKNLPNRGYRVRKRTLRDLLEIIDVRATLEGHAARMVAVSHNPDLPQVLYDLAEKIKKAEDRYHRTQKSKDTIAWSEAECEFHDAIIKASKNNFLIRLMSSFNFHFTISMVDKFPVCNVAPVPTHHDIADAIAQSNAEEAQRLAKQHLNSYKTMGLEAHLGPVSRLDLNEI